MTDTTNAAQGAHERRVGERWHLPAMRAVPALLVGLPIVFIQLHSALVGLIAITALAALTAVALWIGRDLVSDAAGRWTVRSAGISLAAAILGAALIAVAPTATALGLLVAAWGIASGVVELLAWWRMRAEAEPRIRRLALDWRTVGVLTIALGVVLAFVRDEVTMTGLISGYAVIIGVYHALAALSARPASTKDRSRA